MYDNSYRPSSIVPSRCRGANRLRARGAEVSAQQVEVGNVHNIVTCKVGSWVIARIAGSLTERALQYREVGDVHNIVVVGVARQQQAHLPAIWPVHQRNAARIGKGLSVLHPPVVQPGRGYRHGEEATGVGSGAVL